MTLEEIADRLTGFDVRLRKVERNLWYVLGLSAAGILPLAEHVPAAVSAVIPWI